MIFLFKRTFQKNKGFGLVETMISLSVFMLVAFSVSAGFVQLSNFVEILKTKTIAINLATEQIEVIRSLDYQNAVIPETQNIEREGRAFSINTNIIEVDDDFDGLEDGDPADLSSVDYKKVEVSVSCEACDYQDVIVFNTLISD